MTDRWGLAGARLTSWRMIRLASLRMIPYLLCILRTDMRQCRWLPALPISCNLCYEANCAMQRTLGLLFAVFAAAMCGCGDDEDCGTSRVGESCAKTADCECGLRCKDQECVVDLSTDRTCSQIKDAYLQILQDPSTLVCGDAAECKDNDGLCGIEEETWDPAFVNAFARDQLWDLQEEWEINGCSAGVDCSARAGMMPACEDSMCVSSSAFW